MSTTSQRNAHPEARVAEARVVVARVAAAAAVTAQRGRRCMPAAVVSMLECHSFRASIRRRTEDPALEGRAENSSGKQACRPTPVCA